MKMASGAPTKYVLPGEYVYDGVTLFESVDKSHIGEVKEFSLDGDIVVASYPKAGTTWLQEMVWLIQNDGDVETAQNTPTWLRVPFLEFTDLDSGLGLSGMDIIKTNPHPRIVKTHLPYAFFNNQFEKENVKFIIVVRNPKDTLVSFYHFYRNSHVLGHFKGSWEEFFVLFKEKQLAFGDYFSWYNEWWQHKNSPKVLFVKYEDMKTNLHEQVRKISEFLGKKLSETVLAEITSQGSFKAMSSNKNRHLPTVCPCTPVHDVTKFMRKGQVGDWEHYFTPEQNHAVDEQYQSLLENGLTLDFN